MITNPNRPAFYAPTNLYLIERFRNDVSDIAERWMDEAAEEATAGNPEKAGYIEHFVGRLA